MRAHVATTMELTILSYVRMLIDNRKAMEVCATTNMCTGTYTGSAMKMAIGSNYSIAPNFRSSIQLRSGTNLST